MHPTPDYHAAMAFDVIASRDAALVLDQARSLQHAAAAGEVRVSLRAFEHWPAYRDQRPTPRYFNDTGIQHDLP